MSDSTEDFLAHYGVKGMRWGSRRATIVQARREFSGSNREYKKAKSTYEKATGEGKKSALKTLQDAELKNWENAMTAQTLTRGEQIAGAVLLSIGLSPLAGIAFVAGTSIGTSDKRKFRSKYNDPAED